MSIKKKIGILTWHYYQNYGSQLQAYALVHSLREIGYDVRVLNYRNPIFGQPSFFKTLLHKLSLLLPESLTYIIPPRLRFPAQRFRRFYNETKLVHSSSELAAQAKAFDAIICGSDQIWAPNVFNPVYFLDFVSSPTKKISFAASIGLKSIPESMLSKYQELLSTFDSISLREDTGVELLREKCGISSIVVCDPTLLVDGNVWLNIAKKPKYLPSDYVFCYFLNEANNYKETVIKFTQSKELPIVGISANSKDGEWMRDVTKSGIGPKEFIGLVANATYVFTDSYHGAIFSMHFHRPFILFKRFSETSEINQNSRIEQLNKYFNLVGNIFSIGKDETASPMRVNQNNFENKRLALKKQAIEFLTTSIEKIC